MKVDNIVIKDVNSELDFRKNEIIDKSMADIVFVFGCRRSLDNNLVNKIKDIYPTADIIGSSTAGNILENELMDAEIVCSIIQFENKAKTKITEVDIVGKNSYEVALQIKTDLLEDQLKHIFILSDGLHINCSKLINSLNHFKMNATISGGLSADGSDFEKTITICNNSISDNKVVAIGFYGDLEISTGNGSGWNEFGTERLITKSKNNILYEIDGMPALDLYKKYLGEYASELPSSGLRFPISIKKDENDKQTIRSLLGINEEDNSIIFAGDVPEGYTATLMKPNMDSLIGGAKEAADQMVCNTNPGFCIAVSCFGRRVVLNKIVDEEIEAVYNEIGQNSTIIGFYSYGEIAPDQSNIFNCKLHNQTMTLTCIREAK